jgi:hypothetical protein
MAYFEAYTTGTVDPVSFKRVIGDGTGHRAEWVRRVAGVDTTAASISDTGSLVVATGIRVSAFTAGTVVSDASGNFSVSASGGTVTLAGDVTGPSSSNSVVALTGTANVVSMKAGALQWIATANEFEISQADQTTDVRPDDFLLQLSAPFSGATGTARNAPNGIFYLPPPVGAGTSGRWAFSVDGVEKLAIESTQLLLRNAIVTFSSSISGQAGIQYESASGAGDTLSFLGQSSTDNVGGNVIVGSGGGGGGNLAGDTIIRNGATQTIRLVAAAPTPIIRLGGDTLQFGEALTTPTIMQQQRSSDAACADLRIMSQAPFASATGVNQLPGDILYIVPAPVGGGDPPGSHRWYVSDVEVASLSLSYLTLNAGVIFSSDVIQSTPITIDCDIAPAGVAGAALVLQGQQGGVTVGSTNGGDVLINSGAPSGAGRAGRVGLHTSNLLGNLGVLDMDGTHGAVYMCVASPNPGNLPADWTNFVYVGNASGYPAAEPVGGFCMSSQGGRPFFITSANHSFLYDGSFRASSGASIGFVDVEIDGVSRCIQFFALT